jgi:hypothetical protein
VYKGRYSNFLRLVESTDIRPEYPALVRKILENVFFHETQGKLAANSGNRYPGGAYLTVRFSGSGRRHVLKDFFPSDFRNNLAEFVSPLFPSSGFSRVFSCLVPRHIACTSVLLAAIDILERLFPTARLLVRTRCELH